MIAGPTEVLVIADETARPARVAADLIAQAEHDEDAVCWCVTTDAGSRGCVARGAGGGAGPRAARRHRARSRWRETGVIVLVPTMRDAIEVANRRAPEHLEIVAEGAERIANRHSARRRDLSGRRHAGAGRRLHRRVPATCCRPVAPRATPLRSACTTSSSGRASSGTRGPGSPPMPTRSSRWRRRKACSGTRKRCGRGSRRRRRFLPWPHGKATALIWGGDLQPRCRGSGSSSASPARSWCSRRWAGG